MKRRYRGLRGRASRVQHVACLVCTLFCIANMSGCMGSIDARWATGDDTAEKWDALMPALPLDVHSELPDVFSSTEIASATATGKVGALLSPGTNLSTLKHVELFASRRDVPTDDSLCGTAPRYVQDMADHGKVTVTAALCDGPRLVATAKRAFTPDKLAPAQETDGLRSMESRLVDAVTGELSDTAHMYDG